MGMGCGRLFSYACFWFTQRPQRDFIGLSNHLRTLIRIRFQFILSVHPLSVYFLSNDLLLFRKSIKYFFSNIEATIFREQPLKETMMKSILIYILFLLSTLTKRALLNIQSQRSTDYTRRISRLHWSRSFNNRYLFFANAKG